jgi:hypothetical protein
LAFPETFSLVALWSVAALLSVARDKKFGRDYKATTVGFSKKLVIGCRYFP